MSKQKVLMIDVQLFQTAAWSRGMGAYCLALLGAYAARDDALPIVFIANKNIELPQERRETLKRLFPDSSIVMLDLPTMEGNIERGKARATARLDEYIRINHADQDVYFMILSLFMFQYCSSFPTQVAAKLLVFYDLIPLLRWQDFSAKFPAHLYFPHFQTVHEADTLYAISETTKQQLENELSVPSEKIINLDGATIVRDHGTLAQKPDVPKPYVLMPSADLPHKNNENAVRAFAAFNREFGDDFTLVITSTFSEQTQALLQTYSESIVFTGNITDQELDYYYKNCSAILLASYIEGLGLPLLEGVMYSKPVVCSTIDVFEEISKDAFYFAAPNDREAITQSLLKAVAGQDWANKQAEYKKVAAEYTWPTSAKRLAESLLAGPRQDIEKPVHKKGAYNFILPHPATTSGDLGGGVQALVFGLAQVADVRYWVSEDLYVDTSRKAYFMDALARVESVQNLSLAGLRARKNVYFIDETGASVEIIRRALVAPGVCFVVNKPNALLKEMVAAGYLSEADRKELVAAHKSEAVAALLKKAGCIVHGSDILTPRRNNQHIIQDIMANI